MTTTNSSAIFEAYMNGIPNMSLLRREGEAIDKIISANGVSLKFITDIWLLVTKNLSSKKQLLDLEWGCKDIGGRIMTKMKKDKNTQEKLKFFLSPDGIVYTEYTWQKRAKSIIQDRQLFCLFCQELKKILEEKPIVKPAKLQLLKSFVEYADLISADMGFSMAIPKREYQDYSGGEPRNIRTVNFLEADCPMCIHLGRDYPNRVEIVQSGLRDEMLAEQFIEEFTELHKQYKAKMEQQQKNFAVFIEDINKKFEAQIMLQKLKGKI